MNLRQVIKRILSPIQCIRYGIKNHDGFIYIGKETKIVNPTNMTFGKNVSIMPYNMIIGGADDKYQLIVGDNVEIGMFSRIGCVNRVEIGRNVLTGPHVFISDFNHEYRNPNVPIRDQGKYLKPFLAEPGGGDILGRTVGLELMWSYPGVSRLASIVLLVPTVLLRRIFRTIVSQLVLLAEL